MISRRDIERRLEERGIPAVWRGSPPEAFTGVVADSRRVKPGVLFCALRGRRADGHDYLPRAAEAGAAAAVVERPTGGLALPQLVVPDARSTLAHLASLARSDPGTRLRLVAVTGTNGKTTTVWLLRHLLSELAPAAGLGTLGLVTADGAIRPRRLTTPDPLSLMDDLQVADASGARWLAMEVSSHALDQRRVDALAFERAVFTNVTRDHLDYHSDFGAYREAKLRLAELVAPDGTCVANADEPAWEGASFAGRHILRYGVGPGAEVRAEEVRTGPEGSRWRLIAPQGRAQVRLPLLGEFNVSNALAASAVALSLGVSPAAVGSRLERAPQVPGRLEVLTRRPALVLRDYAHTPDALARALDAVRPCAPGRLIVVFGCGGDRDRGKRPLMGQVAVERADEVIVTSDNPRSEPPDAITAEIVDGLPSGSWRVVLDRREAIARALESARHGDLVLLAGKGHERTQILADREVPFDEAEVVSELVQGAVRDAPGGSAGRTS